VLWSGIEMWGWEKRGSLEKIMLDYVRWIFKNRVLHSDICDNEGISYGQIKGRWNKGWRIRAMRYERRLKKRREDGLLRYCWKEKEKDKWKDVVKKEKDFTMGMDGE